MESPEASETPTSATPAPYGHACANCARAKCRCILRANTVRCERCYRLDKQCNPSKAVRRSAYRLKKPRDNQQAPSSRRVQELEQRLDEVVSLLRNVQSQQQVRSGVNELASSSLAGNTQSIEALTAPIPSPAHTAPLIGVDSPRSFPSPQLELPGLNPIVGAAKGNVSVSRKELAPQEAGEYLRTFRTQHLQFFPFVHIPATTIPQQLQQERPFLWLCIRAICTRSLEEQDMLALRIRQELARQMIVEGERNIDLLLGLLALLSWSKYFHRAKPGLCLHLSLASTIVSDLGIDRPLRDELGPHISCFQHQTAAKRFKAGPRNRTNEDRRALLACFIINSFVSSLLKFDAFRWRPYLDEALQTLSADPDCSGDQILVAMARIGLVAQDAADVITSLARSADGTNLAWLHVKPLRSSLEQVKNTLSPEMLQNNMILTYLDHIETLINGIALTHNGPSLSCYQTHVSKRLEILHQCLHSAKSAVERYLSFTPDQYTGVNMIFMMLFRHSTQALYRLSVLEDPAWDRTTVKETIDVLDCLEQAAERLQVAANIAQSTGNGPAQQLFSKTVTALRTSLPAWKAALDPPNTTTVAASSVGIDITADFGGSPIMDFADNMWLTDAFLSWPG